MRILSAFHSPVEKTSAAFHNQQFFHHGKLGLLGLCKLQVP